MGGGVGSWEWVEPRTYPSGSFEGLKGMIEADAQFFAFAGVGLEVVGQQVAATGKQVV